MKKLLSIILVIILVLSSVALVSCKKDNGDRESGGESGNAAGRITLEQRRFGDVLCNMPSNLLLIDTADMNTYVGHTFSDSKSGAKLYVTERWYLQGSYDETRANFPKSTGEMETYIKSAEADTVIADLVYEDIANGAKATATVTNASGETTYRTYYIICANLYSVELQFCENDASRPCGEAFTVVSIG